MVAMNVFRLLGDTSHLLSFIVMFWKLFTSTSVAGISLKTQLLYVIVFCFRYLDIFWNFLSICLGIIFGFDLYQVYMFLYRYRVEVIEFQVREMIEEEEIMEDK